MTLNWQKCLFETLYKNRYLYWFASTAPFAGQWRVWQRLVLSRLYGHDVLELGCGLGDLLADMIAAGYNCQAIEKSPEMVDAARSNLQKHHLGDPSWIIQGQAQYLPFPHASFDTVISTFPSEYIYDPNTISEVKRVLRRGGRLIVIVGANLLPLGSIQPFLLLIQMFVYEPATLFEFAKEGNRKDKVASNQRGRCTEEVITTEVVPDDWFGKYIPLEQYGLRRRCERVRSRDWEVCIVCGEKE